MVHDSFSSHSEGEVEFPQAFEIAEQFGTPPTRSRSIGGRRERFVAKDVSAGGGQKRDRHTQKTDRQKGRLDARYHKELDTTLQVLGIDGDIQKPLAPVRITTSVHTPLVDETPLAPRRTASIASSSVFFSPRAGFGRTPSDAAFSEYSVDDQLGERQGLQDRKGSLPPRHPGALTPVSPGARQPSPRASQGLVSVDHLGDGALHRLQSERQEWHADLDSLLEGNFASEDLDLAITLAKNKANDLKEQLTWWARPPEADWPTREQRLEWLEHALGEAQDIMRAMQSNGALDADIGTYVDIVRVVLKDLRGMSCMIGEAVAEGLRALEPAHHDTKRGFRAANKALHLVLDLTKMLRHISRLDPGAGLELDSTDLGLCAQEVVLATLQATATLQDSLLFPGALSPGSVHSGHELQVKARMLQMCWDSCGKLMEFVAHFWPEKRGSLYCEWCKLFLKAATAAERMQEALRQQSSENLGLDCLSIDETPCPGASGVWGSRTRWNSKSNGTVSDEALQAQAWLPSCLRALLAEAEKAADAVLSWETAAEYEGGGTSLEEASSNPKGTGAACIIVEALSESMYDLAHIGAQRVAKLCREPSGLACWALELLEEQACMAVLFVRDLDRGILGRGSHGLQQYEMLRRGTDALVNGILRVRRLLKQKRTADADDTPVGEPLQPLPSNASMSSLSSDMTSLSTTSAAKQSASRASFSSLTRKLSADPQPEQVATEDTASRPLTPATPTRKVEGSLSAALSSARDVSAASQPGPSLAAPTPDSAAPGPAAAQRKQSTRSLQPSTSSAAVAIPRTSALPAHSTWGKASKAGGAAPRPLPQPAPREAPQDPSADRTRLARFAAGQAQQSRSASPPSKDGSAKDGSTTDSSLKGASRDQSFVFVGHQGTGQLASSPEQLPQVGQPAQPAQPAPPVPVVVAGKPSPAAQHASFRRWASQLDNSPTAQAGVAPEAPPGASPSRDDAVAARFLDAMLQPPEPQAALASGVAEMPSAAGALVRPMPMLTPLPSPFDTEEFQRTSVPVSGALQPAAPPRDSAFLGFPRRSTVQPPTAAASNGAPAAPGMPGALSSQARTDHDRHPGKDRRHSKWKNFGRGNFSCNPDAEPSLEAEPEDSPQSRQGGGRDKGPRGRFSRGSRGRREEEPASAAQAAPEPLEGSALGQTERAASGKPGLLRRFKDALRRPGSGGSRMERAESSMMDRQESVLLTNGSGRALPEPGAPQDNLAGLREESSHKPSSRSHVPDSRPHRSSRHRGHFRPHERTREPERDRSADGGRRHRRRSRRHSSRGRPAAAPEQRPEHRARRKTDGAQAKPAALVMPWEGDPFWQIKWEDIKPALVRKVGSGGFAQVYEVYMYGALMAVKIVNLKADQDLNLSEALVRFKDEVDLQRRLSLHPNVVRFMGACCHIPSTGRPFQDDTLDNWQGVTLAILMELCQYGTLYDVMNQARRIMHINQDIQSGRLPLHYLQNSELKSRPGYKLLRSWRLRLDLALQAAAALSYTHEHGVVHRDLTSTNLLVTNKWECKLSDFGLSRAIEGSHLPNSGQLNSLEWMAPERLVGEDYGTAADVFSYGVVLWELLTLEQPWFNDHERPGLCSRIMPEVHGGNQLFVIRQVPLGVRLPLPSAQDVEPSLPDLPKVVSIIEDCWKDAAQRPTMKQIFDRLKVIVEGLKAQEAGQKSALR